MKAELLTKQGEHVANIEMPFFMTPPEIVVWGQRHFIHDDRPFVESENGLTYYEAFAWFYVERDESEPHWDHRNQLTVEEVIEELDES
jgi:hypothetical protein